MPVWVRVGVKAQLPRPQGMVPCVSPRLRGTRCLVHVLRLMSVVVSDPFPLDPGFPRVICWCRAPPWRGVRFSDDAMSVWATIYCLARAPGTEGVCEAVIHLSRDIRDVHASGASPTTDGSVVDVVRDP